MITVLAGGVGAARFLPGSCRSSPPAEITAIVNVGDDIVLHGLHISPDLDTVTYTLAGAINPETGLGPGRRDAGRRWTPCSATATCDRSSSGRTWFSLGDRDLGTHLYRTHRLAEGASLSRSPPRSPRRGASACASCP